MARIVELCGAPGVGKSAIFNAISSLWKKKNCWVPADKLYPKRRKGFNAAVSKLLLKVEKYFTGSDGSFDERILKKYGDCFVTQNQQYVNEYWFNVSTYNSVYRNGSDVRPDKIKYFYNTIQKFQYLKEVDTQKIAIQDEGIIHRTVNGLFRKDDLIEDQDEIYNYLEIMPLPHAAIYIETDTTEVVRRLMSRKKVIPSHQLLNSEELKKVSTFSMQRMSFAIKILKDKGLNTLFLDSKVDPLTNAQKIIKFIEDLSVVDSDKTINVY